MAEPQPSHVHEGAEQPDVLPANAEDRKAAQALSALDIKSDEDATSAKKEVDLKALNDAMKSLEINHAPKKVTESVKKEEVPKKLVKVDAADIALLVDQLDLSKTRATELLRAHDADAIRAMTAWVTAAV